MPTKQLTALDTYVLPRVNLLPPEIGERAAERRSYVFMGLAVAAAAAAVAGMYIGQASRVSAAKTELQESQADNAKLQADRAKLQTVQDAYAAVDRDEALLTLARARRVNWSVYLHNISISIPENVWITQLTAVVTPPTAAPVAGVVPPVGTLTFVGNGFAYNDVAAWLESVAKLNGVTDATFGTAADVKPASPGGRTIVTFTSTAALTEAAITRHKLGSK